MNKPNKPLLSHANVLEYLQQNPDFFALNPDALTNLKVPHPTTGRTVSLIERQVSVLRERNTELRHKLNGLLSNARDNDRLFQHTKRLVLALLECNELGDLIDALYYSFDKEFGVQFTQLILVGEQTRLSNAKFVTQKQLSECLGGQLKSNRSCIGNLPADIKRFLFAERAQQIGSCAISVLSYGNPLGVIAIGHKDPAYYHTHSGDVFLNHITDVVARIVYQLMHTNDAVAS